MRKIAVCIAVLTICFSFLCNQNVYAQTMAEELEGRQYIQLLRAIANKDLGQAKELIRANKKLVNATQYSDIGGSPLMVAGLVGDIDIVEFLIANGADLNAQDEDYGLTPLMYAVFGQSVPVIERLLKAGANINKINRRGRSALHYAVAKMNEPIVKQLLEAGIDMEVADIEHRTPLGLAQVMFLDPAILPEKKSQLQEIMTTLKDWRTAHPKVVPKSEPSPVRNRIRLPIRLCTGDSYSNKQKEALRLFFISENLLLAVLLVKDLLPSEYWDLV